MEDIGTQLPFPGGAFSVISRNNDTINFSVTQLWNTDGEIKMLAVHYHDAIGSTDCDKNLDVEASYEIVHSAVCVDGFAEVAIFLYVGAGSDFDVPECDACKVPQDDNTDFVAYHMEINCFPMVCPSSSPSLAPSMAPTPTIEILEYECPEDIQLLAVNGITEYGDVPPIHILAQDQYTVTFQVHQNWFAGSVSYMYTQYHTVPNGETGCLANANVTQSDALTFTAECMHMTPLSIIDLWVVDAALDADLDTAEIPECCHPPEDEVLPTVQYTFQLHCVPQCVPTSAPTEAPVIASRARNLRGKDLSL
jgi:hypothetical protein